MFLDALQQQVVIIETLSAWFLFACSGLLAAAAWLSWWFNRGRSFVMAMSLLGYQLFDEYKAAADQGRVAKTHYGAFPDVEAVRAWVRD